MRPFHRVKACVFGLHSQRKPCKCIGSMRCIGMRSHSTRLSAANPASGASFATKYRELVHVLYDHRQDRRCCRPLVQTLAWLRGQWAYQDDARATLESMSLAVSTRAPCWWVGVPGSRPRCWTGLALNGPKWLHPSPQSTTGSDDDTTVSM